MKKIIIVLVFGIAGITSAGAQQLPSLKDTIGKSKLIPFLSDNIAKWPKYYNSFPLNKLQLERDDIVYRTMPYTKSNGNYKMPVVNPATAGVNYTMMVKKVEYARPIEPTLP